MLQFDFSPVSFDQFQKLQESDCGRAAVCLFKPPASQLRNLVGYARQASDKQFFVCVGFEKSLTKLQRALISDLSRCVNTNLRVIMSQDLEQCQEYHHATFGGSTTVPQVAGVPDQEKSS